jgi:RimJ/RimL family protein N-acetyltransferase
VAESDRRRFVELFADADFMVYSLPGVLGRDAAEARFERMLALPEEVPFAKQAIDELSTGLTVGYAGADYFELRGERRLEFGYRLIAGARGRGYATEAAGALLDLACRTWQGELLAFIDPRNQASRRVLGKLHFVPQEAITIRGHDAELYRLVIRPAGL